MAESLSINLFSELDLGGLTLPNRLVMAPMSRLRADAEGVPPPFMAEYYAQRASAGLIITESIAVAPYGAGYPNLPGLYTSEQFDAWRQVAGAVHDRGGRLAAQLWHVGLARTEQEGEGQQPGWAVTAGVKPHELSPTNIAAMIDGYAFGAERALAAGFDAVEIHAGNGFLLDRTLRLSTNRRTDAYGGSIRRCRQLLLDVVHAVGTRIPMGRVGIRLSPSATVEGKPDPYAATVFSDLLTALSNIGLAYVHVTRTTSDDRRHGSGPGLDLAWLRQWYSGVLIGAGEIERDEASNLVANGHLDAVAFGRLFLANPDLPERLRLGAALNLPDPATFYTPGEAGLTDYPRMDDTA